MNRSLTRRLLPLAAGVALSAVSIAQAAPPATCDLTPLKLPLFGGTPVASLVLSATPAATPDVDEATITATLQQYVACINTGDPTLVWAMFSPRWFSTQFADPTVHYLPEFEQMLDGPITPADPPLTLTSVDHIDLLADGRVDVTAAFTSGDRVWTDTLTLAKIDGHWMIDDVRLNTPAP